MAVGPNKSAERVLSGRFFHTPGEQREKGENDKRKKEKGLSEEGGNSLKGQVVGGAENARYGPPGENIGLGGKRPEHHGPISQLAHRVKNAVAAQGTQGQSPSQASPPPPSCAEAHGKGDNGREGERVGYATMGGRGIWKSTKGSRHQVQVGSERQEGEDRDGGSRIASGGPAVDSSERCSHGEVTDACHHYPARKVWTLCRPTALLAGKNRAREIGYLEKDRVPEPPQLRGPTIRMGEARRLLATGSLPAT